MIDDVSAEVLIAEMLCLNLIVAHFITFEILSSIYLLLITIYSIFQLMTKLQLIPSRFQRVTRYITLHKHLTAGGALEQ